MLHSILYYFVISRCCFEVPRCRLACTQRAFRYRAAATWNDLSPESKDTRSVRVFKRALRYRVAGKKCAQGILNKIYNFWWISLSLTRHHNQSMKSTWCNLHANRFAWAVLFRHLKMCIKSWQKTPILFPSVRKMSMMFRVRSSQSNISYQ